MDDLKLWKEWQSENKITGLVGIELPGGEKLREIEEDEYKYLRILEYDRVKEQEMKDKFSNWVFQEDKIDFEE